MKELSGLDRDGELGVSRLGYISSVTMFNNFATYQKDYDQVSGFYVYPGVQHGE